MFKLMNAIPFGKLFIGCISHIDSVTPFMSSVMIFNAIATCTLSLGVIAVMSIHNQALTKKLMHSENNYLLYYY